MTAPISRFPDYLNEGLVKLVLHSAIEPYQPTIVGDPASNSIRIKGLDGRFINFAGCNILGLSNDREVIEAADKILKAGMYATNASPIIIRPALFDELEDTVAEVLGTEAGICFVDTSATNSGVLKAILDPDMGRYAYAATKPHIIESGLIPPDAVEYAQYFIKHLGTRAVFVDQSSHASLHLAVSGLSHEVMRFIYPHNDLEYLRKLLKENPADTRYIITDGLNSADADIPDIPSLHQICQEFDARLFIDDAHGFGLLGPNGLGVGDHFNMHDKIHTPIISLGKAIGIRGGATGGSDEEVRYLRLASPTYMFRGSLPLTDIATTIASLRIAFRDSSRRDEVHRKANILREELGKYGLITLGTGHIVPWFIQDDLQAINVFAELMNHNIYAPALRYPAVGIGRAIIRFFVAFEHTDDQIERLIRVCKNIADKHPEIARRTD